MTFEIPHYIFTAESEKIPSRLRYCNHEKMGQKDNMIFPAKAVAVGEAEKSSENSLYLSHAQINFTHAYTHVANSQICDYDL